LLRASRLARIAHFPFILSHQRDEPGGDAPGTAAPGQKPGAAEDATPADAPARVAAAGRRSLEDELQRKLPGARVFAGPTAETRRIALPPPAPRPLISAIICTRDGVKVLRRCVEGVLERTDWKALELVVVDNGSRDPETLAFLDELRQSGRGRVLRDESPFNFSALNNRAARVARGELLAFLNDDLEILDPQWLTELAVHALRPGIGAVGARLLYPDGRVQHAGVATGVLGLAGHLLRGVARDDPGPNGFARVLRGSTVVTAACMVLRRELFLECGGFDEEHLAVAFNDVDLCLRLAGRGHRNLYVPTAELVHHESWSRGSDLTPARRERFARELQTMLLRWPALDRDPLFAPNLSLATEQLEPGSPPRLPGRLAGALQTTEHPGGELW
jgi:GT2 family glycosyltransferase